MWKMNHFVSVTLGCIFFFSWTPCVPSCDPNNTLPSTKQSVSIPLVLKNAWWLIIYSWTRPQFSAHHCGPMGKQKPSKRQALRRPRPEGLARSHRAGHICCYLPNCTANGLRDDFLPSVLQSLGQAPSDVLKHSGKWSLSGWMPCLTLSLCWSTALWTLQPNPGRTELPPASDLQNEKK